MKIVLLIISVILLLIGSLLSAYVANLWDIGYHNDLVAAETSYIEWHQKLDELEKTMNTGKESPTELKVLMGYMLIHQPPDPGLAIYGGYLSWAFVAVSLLTIVITFAKPNLLSVFIGLLLATTIALVLVNPLYQFNIFYYTGVIGMPLIACTFSIMGAIAAYFGKRKPVAQIK